MHDSVKGFVPQSEEEVDGTAFGLVDTREANENGSVTVVIIIIITIVIILIVVLSSMVMPTYDVSECAARIPVNFSAKSSSI